MGWRDDRDPGTVDPGSGDHLHNGPASGVSCVTREHSGVSCVRFWTSALLRSITTDVPGAQ
jgi:hypothetical protein